MDELWFNIPFNSISLISGRWKGEQEKLCAMKRRLGLEIILPPAGLEPGTCDPKSGVLTALPRGRFYSTPTNHLHGKPLSIPILVNNFLWNVFMQIIKMLFCLL